MSLRMIGFLRRTVERELVVSHRPECRQVSRRRTHVGEADGRFIGRFKTDDLMTARVSAGELRGDARSNLCVAINELKEAGLFERREVVGIVRAGQFRKVARWHPPIQFAERNVGLAGTSGAGGLPRRGSVAPPAWSKCRWVRITQSISSGATPMAARFRTSGVPSSSAWRCRNFRRRLAAVAGVDQSQRIGRADENAVGVELDAMLIVGRRLALPQHARDDAEHVAAVDPQPPAAHEW